MIFKEFVKVYYILCYEFEVINGKLCWCVGECFFGIKVGDIYSMYGVLE